MPVDLKHLIRTIQSTDLVILPRYDPWLIGHADEATPEWVADIIYEQMITKPRARSASFSGSSSGKCPRAQMFGYIGVPTDDTVGSQLANIFADGKWRHMRIQSQLLTAGIIEQIEVPLRWPKMRDRGTADGVGIVPDDHPKVHWRGKEFGLEIKGANSNVCRTLLADGPDKFLRQVHRYFLSSGWDLFIILLENKDTQHITEWVYEMIPKYRNAVQQELNDLNNYVDHQQLPAMLPECTKLTGETFRFCQYGTRHGQCVKTKDWDQALQIAKQQS